MFHRWMSTDVEDEDTCIGCGVTVPVRRSGIVVDHGPLPIECPPPDDDRIAHHFALAPDGIECAYCTVVIDDLMDPTDVDWYCVPR